MDDDRYDYLAQFLGPKGENAELMESLLTTILRDHVHWRRNYFPQDPPLLPPSRRRALEDGHDRLEGAVGHLMAELRRNFPFFSPRYIGHQLSDVSMPALLGYFAGMLYNPNNVTSEAAPVTAGWEIDACALVLEMLGYTPPPAPPTDLSELLDYERRLQSPFGYAHITSGGTVANIEALWVARNVRYGTLAVKDAAAAAGIELPLTLPDRTSTTVGDVDHPTLLTLHPDESLALTARLVEAYARDRDIDAGPASAAVLELARASPYHLSTGWARCASDFPPVVLASGAAHYSIGKAADILGIGGGRVRRIRPDSDFRLDVDHLEEELRLSRAAGLHPLMVVAVAGTTEEGAVDPVHEVVALRDRLATEQSFSFWVHVDAAWGGYFRSLFRVAPPGRLRQVARRVGERCGVPYDGDAADWHARLADLVARRVGDAAVAHAVRARLDAAWQADDDDAHRHALGRVLDLLGDGLGVLPAELEFTAADQRVVLQEFTRDTITISFGGRTTEVTTSYAVPSVLQAFEAFPLTDSITVDPHKMGYVGYPCGVVAFRDDRVRFAISHRAPYITARNHAGLIHLPPKHVPLDKIDDLTTDLPVSVEALAPFMLEGSKPGAAAASLLLSSTVLPLHLHAHGSVVRSSLVAARELYEWLDRWGETRSAAAWPRDFEIVTCTPGPPDTNLVTFVMVPRRGCSLAEMNEFSRQVYDHYSIQVEEGAGEHSYGQPFFLSRTTCTEPNYPLAGLVELFARCALTGAEKDYATGELLMLRAAVMNPYIAPLRDAGVQDTCREFVIDLDRAARAVVGGT